jgi:hypothetical protein
LNFIKEKEACMSTVFFAILSCVGRDLAMDQSPTQEVLPGFTVSEGKDKKVKLSL